MSQIDYKEEIDNAKAVFDTTMGAFSVNLDLKLSPKAGWNFINLAEGRQETEKEGPFYNGIIFHRVIDGFMIQAGCPQGLGTGGPGYEFENEYGPEHSFESDGVMAMANRGPNTNGSQFFITVKESVPLNPADYTVFGKVVEGLDIVKKIAQAKVDPYNNHRPYEDVVINSVTIER